MTLNFGKVAIRQLGAPALPGSVGVWNGAEWVPWEAGTDEDRQAVRELAMSSPCGAASPSGCRGLFRGSNAPFFRLSVRVPQLYVLLHGG